eukprot:1855397-Alexandrium_andersonii.AAC.1
MSKHPELCLCERDFQGRPCRTHLHRSTPAKDKRVESPTRLGASTGKHLARNIQTAAQQNNGTANLLTACPS